MARKPTYEDLEQRVKELEREAEVEIKTTSLEEVNTALKVLLKRRNEDKTELEEKVLSNMKELALPYLEKLKKSGLDERQRVCIDVPESDLNDIIWPFLRSWPPPVSGLHSRRD